MCPMCIIDGIVVCWDCCSREGGHPEFACSACDGVGSRVSELPPNEGAIGADCISCDGIGIDEQAWNDALEKNAESFAAEEKTIKVGLVKGRHELPVDNYVFGEIVHSNGFAELILNKLVKEAKQWISRNSYVGPGTVELYITGFTPALTAFIIAWNYMDVDFELIFKHYDNETGDYVSQTYEAEDWATNH